MSLTAYIDNNFSFHPANTVEKQDAHEKVRASLKATTKKVVKLLPNSREQSLFMTKMEEAMFWANAAIARADS